MPSETVTEPERRQPDVRLRWLKLAAWGLVLLIVVLAGLELSRRARTPGTFFSIANYEATAETVDAPAPDFELPLLSGAGSIRLADLRGGIVVVNFWASWCSPCRLEAPDLQATWLDYRDRGVRFVGVDELDDRSAARGFVGEFGITYPSVFDPSGSLADDFGFIGLPATYVIDPGGRIVYRFQGFLNGRTLRRALDDVLAGTEA